MQIRDIEYVDTIARYGSFSMAAKQLFVSQPALSQQVARLEQELQVQLFKREKKAVIPTEACLALLEDGQQILLLRDRILKKMDDYAGLRAGSLNISISAYYHKCFLAPLQPRFHQLYPGIKLNVTEAYYIDQAQLLRDGKVDLCITSLPLLDKNMEFRELFTVDIQLAVPQGHPANEYLAPYLQSGLTMESLRLVEKEKFIMYKKGRHLQQICMGLCRAAGFAPDVVYETQSCESVTGLIAQGMAIGFLPKNICSFYLQDTQPVCYDIHASLARQTFVLAYRSGELSPEAQAFADFLAEESK